MPWYEKETTSPFENMPINGLYFLHGDVLAKQYHQEWVRGKKYPTIAFPSDLQRELSDSSDNGGTLNIFGAFELLRSTTRDEGFQSAIEFASQFDYTVARRGKNQLLVFHPHSGNGYEITYDNQARQISNVNRFPHHAMELLDAPGRAVLPELYANEKIGLNAIAPIKFFTPDSNWTWYASEYDGKDLFFGLVTGFEVELGYFSYSELEGVRGGLGLPLERDLHFTPKTLRELKQWHEQQY